MTLTQPAKEGREKKLEVSWPVKINPYNERKKSIKLLVTNQFHLLTISIQLLLQSQ